MKAFQTAQRDLEFAVGFGQGVGTVYSYLESNQKEIIYLQSSAHIENSIRVKKLEEEKKEITEKH